MKVRAHLFISGKVQGVGYRIFMSEVALTLELTGWVMNVPDTRLEAVFEGDKTSIKAAIKKCAEGIPSAVVTGVDVNWEESPEDITAFMIRY
jgi:acylphosphatase